MMKGNKSGKSKSSPSSSSTTSSSVQSSKEISWITLFFLVIAFFVCGVYIGSLVVSEEITNELPTVGLPGTNNVLITWAKSELDTIEKSFANIQHKQTVSPPHIENSNTNKKPVIESSYLRKQVPVISTKETTTYKTTATKTTTTDNSNSVSSILTDSKSMSLHVDDNTFMIASSSLDNNNILIAAWIYLDETIQDVNMRTIFSNKNPGCESGSGQNGISMYVNAWETSDHKVYVEYGGAQSGCHKLDSDKITLQMKKWYHVAAYFGSQDVVIFLDGELINHKSITDPHVVQRDNKLLVGQYSSEAKYPFYGNISSLFVYHDPSSGFDPSAIQGMVKQMAQGWDSVKASGVAAFYPLSDAKPTKGSKNIAVELAHGLQGAYVLPPRGGQIAGVSVALVDGTSGDEITQSMKDESDRVGRERRDKIRTGMKHVWGGYKRYAWGFDELKPVSNRGQNNWGGVGMTLVDSLDTLWIMGMKEEFNEAKEWVSRSLTFDRAGTVSVFEVTIRELGGLLAAYDLSGEQVFLDKAKALGDRLIGSFNTNTGIPTAMVNLRNGQPASGWSGNSAILSELGTLQIEFRALGQHLKDPHYEEAAMKPLRLMASKNPPNGLYPIKVSIDSGNFADNMVTFGALGDSFYEYLLKVWIQGGRKETWLRQTYDRAMDGAIGKLLMTSSPSGLAFLSDWNGHNNFRKMDHLVCFMPGLLALGAYTDPNGLSSDRAQRDLRVAKALMYTCREMYHRMGTGIAAEYVEFPPGRDLVPGPNVAFYILRPETAESLFILNQLTGDPIYRDWAWEIWEAIDKACKTSSGYASLRNVNNAKQGVDDRMESFFLAETIKYLYLAQDPDNSIDLMKYVFNTEAHPTLIFDDSHQPVAK